MSETQDKTPPPPDQHRLRDQVWHPVRDSGWLVLLAAALGGCLIGLLANPFPAWCDIPKEANIVCAREWLSAFSGYFGGVLTLIAAWIAFGPAKRAMELQEISILDAKAISLREILILLGEYRKEEEGIYKLLKSTHSIVQISQNKEKLNSAKKSIDNMKNAQSLIILKLPTLGSENECKIIISINSLKETTEYYNSIIKYSQDIKSYQNLTPNEQESIYKKDKIIGYHKKIISLDMDDIIDIILIQIDNKTNRSLHLSTIESRNRQ